MHVYGYSRLVSGMAGFGISARALNNFIKLGVASIVTGSVVNSTLYNGKLVVPKC